MTMRREEIARLRASAKETAKPKKKRRWGRILLTIFLTPIALLAVLVAIVEATATPEDRARWEAQRLEREAQRQAEAAAEAAARAAEERRIAAAEEAERREIAEKEAEDRRYGFHCLSEWNGANQDFINAVKENLREPRSFRHSSTRMSPVDEDGFNVITMEYRAENGFGGTTVEKAIGLLDNESCELMGWMAG